MTSANKAIEIQMPPLHAKQTRIRLAGARFKVVACGRRFGKTTLGVAIAFFEAAIGGHVWWVAPSYKVALIGWRMALALIAQLPPRFARVIKSQFRIEFAGGGFLEIRSAQDPKLLRGEGLTLAIFDEAAFQLETVWVDVVQPALADKEGSAIFLSTPNGRNWFWRLYLWGKDEKRPLYEQYHYTSADNPFFPIAEFERLKDEMPADTFAQEHLAQFIEDAGLVFRRVTQQVVEADWQPRPHRTYVFGVDWGKWHDFTVVAVVCVETRQMVYMDRFNQVSWRLQRERIHTLADKWKPEVILAESNSIGEPNIEALQDMGLNVEPFETTQKSKAALIDALAVDLENERIWLYKDEQLINEMIAFTVERQSNGKWKYGAPAGFFDDCVIATALAFLAARGPTGLGFG